MGRVDWNIEKKKRRHRHEWKSRSWEMMHVVIHSLLVQIRNLLRWLVFTSWGCEWKWNNLNRLLMMFNAKSYFGITIILRDSKRLIRLKGIDVEESKTLFDWYSHYYMKPILTDMLKYQNYTKNWNCSLMVIIL